MSADNAKALQAKLNARPSVSELEKKSVIHNANVASSIAGAAHSVEKGLLNRETFEALGDKGIVDPKRQDPAAYEAARQQERERKKQVLEGRMQRRPSAAELQQRNVLYSTKMDPSLHANALALRKDQITRNLASSMSNRPADANSIPYMEHKNVAPSVRGVAYSLNNQLQQRPQASNVSHLQQAYSTQAASLQPAGYAISNALQNRPAMDDLHARGIVGVGERKNQNAQLLQQQLGRRQSRQEVQNIMPHSNVAPRLQGAAYELQSSLASRSAPSQPNFISNDLANSMQPAAYELNKKLGRRMSKDDLANRGLFRSYDHGHAKSAVAEKLSKRPERIPDKYAPMGAMASSIQGSAHAINQRLANRPSRNDVQYFSEDAKRQAPAIQSAGAQVRKALGRRPSRAELEANNILNRMGGKSILDRAGDLAGAVAKRPTREQLPGTIYQDHSHISAGEESKERFRRNSNAVGEWLTQRPIPNAVPSTYFQDASANKKRGSTEFKPNEFELAWETQFTTRRPKPQEIPSKYFQEPGIQHRSEAFALERSLRRRPTLDKLEATGIIKNSRMAPSLRGAAESIKEKIGHVPNYEDMLKAGFTPEYLMGKSSASIQPAAKRVSNFLGRRMSKDELQRRGILRDQKASYDRQSELIQPMFMQRKDRSELNQRILTGGVNENMADSMKGAAFSLQKKLRNRRGSDALLNQNILKVDPNSNDRLAMHKYYQDQKNRKKNLENSLKRRASIDDLQARGIFQGRDIHDQFAGRRAELKKNMLKHDLKDKLASRPQAQEVPNKYFMEPKQTRRRRQSDAFQQKAQNMEKMLQNRPIQNAIPSEYFQQPNQVQEARQSIAQGFKNRMTPEEMMRRGLIAFNPEEGYAPVDMAIFKNDRSAVKEKLAKQLQSRPQAQELEKKGYVMNANMAHGIQGAAHSLEGKLRRRMSVDDLQARNIMRSTGLAPKLQARADQLEKEKLVDTLNGRLSRRPEREELLQKGIVGNHGPRRHEAQRQLEYKLRQNQMKDMLATRPKEHEVDNRYFVEARQGRGRAMSRQMQGMTAEMEKMLHNRPAAYEVPNRYFAAPSRKRRMSVEMESIARKLDSKLQHRPAKEDINDKMWITAKDAQGHRGRRVSHSMAQNQNILAGLLRDKKEMDQINESVFREPSNAVRLEDQLTSRMSREELQRRGILNQYANNQQLAGRMTELDKRLGRRPTLDHLQQQNIIHRGYGYQMNPSMAAQKEYLDRQLLKNNLNQRLLNRPEKSELADRGYLDDSGLAPRLHPAALSLNQQLVDGTRVNREELIRRGIISGSSRRMSRTLAPVAHQLEKKLKRRMSVDDLARRNIIDNSGMSPRVQAAHKSLSRGRRASRVEQMLQHRPGIKTLQEKGIYSQENVAPKLQGAAANISKHLKRRPSQADVAHLLQESAAVSSGRHEERLEDFLAARPLPSDLKRKGVLPGVAIEHQLDDYKWIDNREEYAALQKKKHQQEMASSYWRQAESQEWIEMKPTSYRRDSLTQRNDVQGIGAKRMRRMSRALEQKFRNRPAMSELADRGLLDDSGLAPRLHPTALQVQMNLTSRLQREELIKRGILPDQSHHVSNKLAGRVQNLNERIGRRPTITEVAGHGYIPPEYAQQFETKKDRRRRISVALENKLRMRPTKESLADQGILDDSPLAPSLHAKAIDLQTRLIQQMDREELQERGILTSDATVARSLQGTRAELENKMRRRMSRQDMSNMGYLNKNSTQVSTRLAGAAREISKGLRRRPSIDDLRNRNILSQYDQSMPPEMIALAKEKNRMNKANRIKDMLATRPAREEIGAYKNFAVSDMANSLQGPGAAVSKLLKRRPSVDVLQQRNILQGSYQMGASAGRAHELGFQQRRATISQFMEDQNNKRRQQATLEKFGLPTNIATSDHIQRVVDMNQKMMAQMQQMQDQLNVLQMTCAGLVQEREMWKDQVKSIARQNTHELEMMKDYLRDTIQQQSSSSNNLAAPKSPNEQPRSSFRSELRDFKEQVVGMQEQARKYLLNERERFQVKESAFKAHMLESDIQVTRLQGEYEFTITSSQAGLKFESCDNGRNLCVKAVLKGSQPEQNGVMPGDVIITIRNPKEGRVRRVENQDAQVTLELFRAHPRPMICKFRKYEAHHQLRDLWRRKRELLENVPAGYNAYAKSPPTEPGAKPTHKRRSSNLFHETEISQNGITQDMLTRKREMEDALLQLKAAGHIDPIVRAFEEMDENQNGDLNEDEFVKGLYNIGIGEGLTDAQMKHVFKVLDDDNSGYIDYQEFEEFLKHGQSDAICEFVQRHIRDRISRLITHSPQDRIVRAGSMTQADITNQQKKQMVNEREEMMRMLEQANGKAVSRQVRSNTVDGDNPKAWREGYSEEDRVRLQQLTGEIGNILENAQSWRVAINAIQSKIPNLEYEIAKELYPLIQDRTIVERKDMIRRTLHIVDVIHAKVAPTKEELMADQMAAKDIDKLVENARRFSTNDAAVKQMESIRYAQEYSRREEEQRQDEDSSEEEYDFVPASKADPTQASLQTVNKQLQMENSGITSDQLDMFKQQMNSMSDIPSGPSAFDEEEAETRNKAARQAIANKPTVGSKRRRPSRQARQDALQGLTGKVDVDASTPSQLPDINLNEPPANGIQRRTSERIASTIPKQARGSLEAPILDVIEADGDDNKRLPETPRQSLVDFVPPESNQDVEDDEKRSPKNVVSEPRGSTGGGELVPSGDEIVST